MQLQGLKIQTSPIWWNNNFMHSIIDETFKYLFSLFGQGLASERSHPNLRMIILHLFQPVYSFKLLCWPNNWNDKSYAVLCVSVLHELMNENVSMHGNEWIGKNQAKMNEWAKIKQKWGQRPACFLGSNVAKELLNFTNSGS